MAINEITSGIARGTAVCAMPDGSTIVASEGGTLTKYDGAGGVLETVEVGAPVGALAAQPDGSLLATVARRGLFEVRFAPDPPATLRLGLRGARGVALDGVTGRALVTSMRSRAASCALPSVRWSHRPRPSHRTSPRPLPLRCARAPATRTSSPAPIPRNCCTSTS